ncbi:TPA: lipase maturation factor family protein [Enterobacter hormaechei subsp. steigerwaltii]|nr:lipase maturation factor family protein [Enterobacter hormaechei subsp. steigerwaltii]
MDIKQKNTNTLSEPNVNNGVSTRLSLGLILIALHLMLMLVIYGVSLLVIFFNPTIYSLFQHASQKIFFMLNSGASLLSLVLMALSLVALFRKQSAFVGRYRLFIYSIALISVIQCASLLWFHAMGYDFKYRYDNGGLFREVMIAFIHPVLLVCICIPYLEKSQRVEAILTN